MRTANASLQAARVRARMFALLCATRSAPRKLARPPPPSTATLRTQHTSGIILPLRILSWTMDAMFQWYHPEIGPYYCAHYITLLFYGGFILVLGFCIGLITSDYIHLPQETVVAITTVDTTKSTAPIRVARPRPTRPTQPTARDRSGLTNTHINAAMEAIGIRTPNMLTSVHTLDQNGIADFNLQVGKKIYRVTERVVLSRALILDRIVKRVRDTVDPIVGKWENHALILDVNSKELKCYLEYIIMQEYAPGNLVASQASETCASLSGLLHIATIFYDPLTRGYALTRLDTRDDFTAAHRLTTSVQYRIPEWFESGAKGMLSLALSLYTPDVVRACADADALSSVLRIKSEIIRSRVDFVTRPPLSNRCRLCPTGICGQKWIMEWTERGVPLLTDGYDVPLTERDVQEVEGVLRAHKNVCDACFDENIVVLHQMYQDHEQMTKNAVAEWKASIHFHNIEATVQAIKQRSRDDFGLVVEDNLEFLALCSGLGAIHV